MDNRQNLKQIQYYYYQKWYLEDSHVPIVPQNIHQHKNTLPTSYMDYTLDLYPWYLGDTDILSSMRSHVIPWCYG